MDSLRQSLLDRQDTAAAEAALLKAESGSVVVVCNTATSIYDQYSKARRFAILGVVAMTAIIVPLSDTIFLPGISEMKEEFNTNQQMAALTVSLYLLSVGISALVWGNLSDRFGRRPTYLLACAAFVATTIGCIYTRTIEGFIICRMLQGLAVPPFTTNSTACVADVFHPRERGMAMGIRSLPLLIGPVAGPVLGGFLCQTFGWRSTFILLVVMAVSVLPLLLLVVPETHQYKVLQRLERENPAAAAAIEEAAAITASPPVFRKPWAPLSSLFGASCITHCLISMLAFGSWFAVLGEMAGTLAHAPYSLSQSLIGLSFVPMGIAGMIASPLGGLLADKAAAAAPGAKFARLKWGTGFALVVMPAGLVLFGCGLQFQLHIVVPFMGSIITAVASFAYMPGYFSFLANSYQQQAASVTGAAQAALFAMAGVIFQSASAGVAAWGPAAYFSLLAGLQALLALVAIGQFVSSSAKSAAYCNVNADVV